MESNGVVAPLSNISGVQGIAPTYRDSFINFLEEFKIMFQQLTHQNSMILNMLSTRVSKLH
jgi:hypothetical protein